MEQNKSAYIEPISGRRSIHRANAVRLILEGLVTHSMCEPFPAMSDHYHAPEQPGAIGNAALPSELRDPVDVSVHGWRVSPEDMRIPHSSLGYE